ncbi:MAG TPA: FHA domain-containing protein [Chloroflexi bacterium]|nr:FHA domain-containing protein [Chloroflexota bacterium]
MITCPHCKHPNMEGALFCEECGLSLWSDPDEQASTRKLDEDSNEFSVKSGWGTATFREQNEVIIHVRDADEPISIRPGVEFLIGRSDSSSGINPDLDLTPYGALEKGVSRIHAALRRGEDVLSIVDLDSANGTYLNGQRLAAHQPRLLRDGDEIRLGKLVMHIYFK